MAWLYVPQTESHFPSSATNEEKFRVNGYDNMIQPSKEGPEGDEIPIINFACEERWSFPYKLMSDSYILSIPDLKYHTNQEKFRGFKSDEVWLADDNVDDSNIPQTAEEKRLANVTAHTIGSIVMVNMQFLVYQSRYRRLFRSMFALF